MTMGLTGIACRESSTFRNRDPSFSKGSSMVERFFKLTIAGRMTSTPAKVWEDLSDVSAINTEESKYPECGSGGSSGQILC